MRAISPRLCLGTLQLLLLALFAGACDDPDDPPIRPNDAGYPDLPRFIFPEAGDVVALEPPPAGSDRCAGAIAVALSGSAALIKGTTNGAVNEFGDKVRCGELTPFSGPQRYYKLTLKAGTLYRLQLTPQFDAVLYLFNECSRTLINVDCASQGATGLFSGIVAKGSTKTLHFEPSVSGTYHVAVDSTGPSGAFELQVEAIPAAAHATCAKAQPLTLTGGKVSVKGSTAGSKNEFAAQVSCNTGLPFLGPQVYYRVSLSAGSWYRLRLEPQFDAALYLARVKGTCSGTGMDTDCGSVLGTVLPVVPAGGQGATAYSPFTSGDHLVVVDSLAAAAEGAFTLTVEHFSPAGNMLCQTAEPLVKSGGMFSLTGSTAGVLNDLGVHVKCGTSPPLLGPQRYYSVALEPTSYELTLKPAFEAVLALGSSCSLLPNDCGGKLSGTFLEAPGGKSTSVVFSAPLAGTYVLAVDGTSSQAFGSFELQIKPYTKPTNGLCASPQAVALSSNPTVRAGDTGPFKNDLKGISCGGVSAWPGPQAYYHVALKGGTNYKVTLKPEATFDPALYAFAASTVCSAAAVNAACAGKASDVVGSGKSERLVLAPAADTDYVLVVDSWSASEVGTYTLSISWPP